MGAGMGNWSRTVRIFCVLFGSFFVYFGKIREV
nr:MAG TPA: 3-dehydroquinate dehydratase [Caudoviricetes sp.]DAU61883.1 MAG TPA: 3-dehydroquinate dehydratase [Caudoviricetes sp.]